MILGSAGFVGSNLCRKLQGYRLVCVDKLSDTPAINNVYFNKNHDFYVADICQLEIMKNILIIEGVDVIINTIVPTDLRMVAAITELAELAVAKGVKAWLQLSFAPIPSEALKEVPENKERLADFCLERALNFIPQTVFVRCSQLFGPRQAAGALISDMCKAALSKQCPKFTGIPDIDLVYINDFCNAICLLLKQNKLKKIYQIAADDMVSDGRLWSTISAFNPEMKREGYPEACLVVFPPTSNNIRELGWEESDLDTGLAATYQWYLNNAWFFKTKED